MSMIMEDDIYKLKRAFEKLWDRVTDLEAKVDELSKGKVVKRTKNQRVKKVLESTKGDLAMARDAARHQGDTEVVEAIEDLMSKVT